MRTHRIYHSEVLKLGDETDLSSNASHHLINVLRASVGQDLELFCGDNHRYECTIVHISKKNVQVKVLSRELCDRESPLHLHLGQVISRGEKMDFTIQKAVELGVKEITPLTSERCGVKLTGSREQKRFEHWQKIIISACEQCGRNTLPVLRPLSSLNEWLAQEDEACKLMMDCHETDFAAYDLSTASSPDRYRILVGPEGGLTPQEKQKASELSFLTTQLGPRVLRTETAALALLSLLQFKSGDFSAN